MTAKKNTRAPFLTEKQRKRIRIRIRIIQRKATMLVESLIELHERTDKRLQAPVPESVVKAYEEAKGVWGTRAAPRRPTPQERKRYERLRDDIDTYAVPASDFLDAWEIKALTAKGFIEGEYITKLGRDTARAIIRNRT
jgi:hypothetical protein